MSWFNKIAQQYYDPDVPRDVDVFPKKDEELDEELPVVEPEDVQLADNDVDVPIETEPPPGIEETFLSEVPEQFFIKDEQSVIEKAIEDLQCISFEYTSLKRKPLGWRLVEPAGIWTAKTGNTLVCGFDRGRDDIRAFSIKPENMDKLKIMQGNSYHFNPKFIFNPS